MIDINRLELDIAGIVGRQSLLRTEIDTIVVDKTGEPLDGVQVSAIPDFRSGTGGRGTEFGS